MQLQIFRLFENLIGLFEGLANVYRRGIDKDKVTNLFSNLDTSQLTDKMFEIPRIGAVDEPEKAPEQRPPRDPHSNSSSQRSETVSESSSSNTYKSKQKQGGGVAAVKSGLTKEALHPEMHLFRRRQTPKNVRPNEKWLIEGIREAHHKKEMREGLLLQGKHGEIQ